MPERLVRGSPLLSDAISFFGHLRQDDLGLRKRPGTAELLNWLAAMLDFECEPGKALLAQAGPGSRTLAALAKMDEDQVRIREAFKQWIYK